MSIDLRSSGALMLFVPLVAGCATSSSLRLEDAQNNWGEANRQTMAAQIIDPAPHYDYAVPESSGEHAQQAIERYRKGEVKQPERVRTTNVGVSGGGGSSSSSSSSR